MFKKKNITSYIRIVGVIQLFRGWWGWGGGGGGLVKSDLINTIFMYEDNDNIQKEIRITAFYRKLASILTVAWTFFNSVSWKFSLKLNKTNHHESSQKL